MPDVLKKSSYGRMRQVRASWDPPLRPTQQKVTSVLSMLFGRKMRRWLESWSIRKRVW